MDHRVYATDYDLNLLQEEKTIDTIKFFNSSTKNIKGLTIFSINIRSISANLTQLCIMLESLLKKPDIIICTEAWLEKAYLNYNIEGYTAHTNNSKKNQSDGTIIYIKKNIKAEPQLEETGPTNILSVTITLSDNKKIKVSAVYKNHSIDNNLFFQGLSHFLKKNKSFKNHIVAGDFNINLLVNNHDSESLLQTFLEYNFLPNFLTFTRTDNKGSGSCIDNIFVKTKNFQTHAFKIIHKITDHYPLALLIETDHSVSQEKTNFKYHHFDSKIFQDITQRLCWDLTEQQTVDEKIETITNKLNYAIKTAEVEKTFNSSIPRNKWITPALIRATEKKNFLYNEWKKDVHDLDKKEKFTKYSNKLKNIIKKVKNEHEKSKVKNIKNDCRKIWQYINDKLGKSSKHNTIKNIKIKNSTISNSQEIANNFNQYFINVSSINTNQENPNSTDLSQDNTCKDPKKVDESLFLHPTNELEILSIIKSLKNKIGGIDHIHAKHIKLIAPVLLHPLTTTFNQVLTTGIWPTPLKKSEVFPVYKSGKKDLMQNYRPISLISNFAKILEKLVHTRLYKFLTDKQVLSKNQYAYMKNKNTTQAISNLTNYIYTQLDQSKPVLASFIDVRKAFDSVDHKCLLNKLEVYGIRGVPLQLITNYLTNRTQCTKIENSISNFEVIKTGVPQGTTLGPLLFITYINDLFNNIPSQNITCYADDTAIYCSGDTWKQAEQKMNEYLSTTSLWFKKNNLTVNTDKTVYMYYVNYYDRAPRDLNIVLNNVSITQVSSTKYLGVLLDRRLTWTVHTEFLYKKLKYFLYVINKLRDIVPLNIALIIYYGLFESTITYAIPTWGSANSTILAPLVNLQKRIINGLKKYSENNKKRNLNFQKRLNYLPDKINDIYKFKVLLLHHQDLRNNFLNSGKSTRNKGINLPKVKLEAGKKTTLFNATKIYNQLDHFSKTIQLHKKTSYKVLRRKILSLENTSYQFLHPKCKGILN